MATPETLTQAEFAERRGVNKATVTKWKARGLLALNDDGKVVVEASEWNLDQQPAKYRGGTTHRAVRTAPEHVSPTPKSASLPAEVTADELDAESPNLPLAEAVRRKENFLGLQRKQQFEERDRALVDRGAAERVFFEAARDLRDAWLAWPARIAIIMASELGVDARALTTVLTAHVQQHLSELGEPAANL